MPEKALILVLGDQLSHTLSSLRSVTPIEADILMAEVMTEATYIPHHKKKIAFVFTAMRHFADELIAAGWQVHYTKIDDPENAGSLKAEVARHVSRAGYQRLMITEPGEWRLVEDVRDWGDDLGLEVTILSDDRFLCSHEAFDAWAAGRKQLRMAFFYREMRRKTGLLMKGKEPVGGQWDFDADNRKPPTSGLKLPVPQTIEPDPITQDVLNVVARRFDRHIGSLEGFGFAVTAQQAEKLLDDFLLHRLAAFGDYQDAMVAGEPFMFHSLISFYLNAGLLDPLQTCQKAEAAYKRGDAPLNAVEGFIRQIIGWREFVRGIYWLKMPDYVSENFLSAYRPLPDFYWTGETDMYCLSQAIGQTLDHAYAHHIQRLMLTGNFALLAGIDPVQVHEWYLAVYADAYEWVELPNTLGMSQFADGGVLGSKPYAASGNYINKMSNYCSNCRYDVKQKTGDAACPFNALYWDFLVRNEDKLRGNPRVAPIYRSWAKMAADKQDAYLKSADTFLSSLTPQSLSGDR